MLNFTTVYFPSAKDLTNLINDIHDILVKLTKGNGWLNYFIYLTPANLMHGVVLK